MLSKNRIEALTDGIFAFVMTLLVLDISVPQTASSHYYIDSVAAETELLNRLSSSKADTCLRIGIILFEHKFRRMNTKFDHSFVFLLYCREVSLKSTIAELEKYKV